MCGTFRAKRRSYRGDKQVTESPLEKFHSAPFKTFLLPSVFKNNAFIQRLIHVQLKRQSPVFVFVFVTTCEVLTFPHIFNQKSDMQMRQVARKHTCVNIFDG
ncbi:hypothetical protein NQD34_009284 [Periophthalmus magnuspinnatus]|nr:hypothetical protein NQD34_009284 [Periophthalmus magnuspinnatus]